MIINNFYGGKGVKVEALNVTSNGTYTAPSGKAYSPVTVNVPDSGHQINGNEINVTSLQIFNIGDFVSYIAIGGGSITSWNNISTNNGIPAIVTAISGNIVTIIAAT